MQTANLPAIRACRPAWNKGRIVGQKRPLLTKHVWAIRVRLEIAAKVRQLAIFNLVIDSKLRGCDLVKLKVADVFAAGQVKERASIIQSKTRKPVRLEITEDTRRSLTAWLDDPMMNGSFLSVAGPFPRAPAHLNPAIRPPCSRLGDVHWSRAECLRHAFDAPHEGRADL